MGPECNFPPSGESSAGCYSDDQRWRVEALFAWGMIGHTFISVSVSHSIVLFSGIMNDNTHDDGGFHSIFEKSLISIFFCPFCTLHGRLCSWSKSSLSTAAALQFNRKVIRQHTGTGRQDKKREHTEEDKSNPNYFSGRIFFKLPYFSPSRWCPTPHNFPA